MKMEVVTRKEFDLSESAGKVEFAKHLANSGVTGVCLQVENREVNLGEGIPPVQLPTGLLVDQEGRVISETPSNSPDFTKAIGIYSQMQEVLARVIVAREKAKERAKADGTGKRPGRPKRDQNTPIPQDAAALAEAAAKAQKAKAGK